MVGRLPAAHLNSPHREQLRNVGRLKQVLDLVKMSFATTSAGIQVAAGRSYSRRRGYVWFIVPGLVVILAVVVFPWVYTIWMSVNNWTIGFERMFIGLDNFRKLARDTRFLEAVGRTFLYTALAVVLPVIFGTASAVVFHQRFPLRDFVRGIFILPLMATPVAIGLVFVMMMHPQLGALNYLLSLIGIPPQLWIYSQQTVIPSLILAEVFHWTPLMMLIVLGGMAVLPSDLYEAALIDGANAWQRFRYITFPLVLPFLMSAMIIRTIDALKSLDLVFVMTQGGPGNASEILNVYLFLQAFRYYHIGHASAVVIAYFAIIVLFTILLAYIRRKTVWTY